jgi:hypothetical protein
VGWQTVSKCISTEKGYFSFVALHPICVLLNTKGLILLLPDTLYLVENGREKKYGRVEVGKSHTGWE